MTSKSVKPSLAPQPSSGRTLKTASLVLLLCVLAARAFVSELPFRLSTINTAAVAALARGEIDREHFSLMANDSSELAKMIFSLLLLIAAATYLVGGAVSRRLELRHPWLAALILLFSMLALVSALNAADKRSALNVWLEQTSLMLAAFTVVQICRDRRAFALVIVVLTGLAGAMALKGLYQVLVEVPERIAQYEQGVGRDLLVTAARPDTPQARLYEARLRDPAALGYVGLANLFASLMIVLLMAAAGLTVDKLALAMRRPGKRGGGLRNEIPLPVLAAALTAIIAALAGVVLILTRSRGGVLAGAVSVLVFALVWWRRAWLAARWKKTVLAAGGVFIGGAIAVAAYGLLHDRLPTKTMTFRWHYWTASARMVEKNSLLGVGGGNFGDRYLTYRRPAAEEAVKTPHNVLLHAGTQFGIPGGLVYMLVVGYVLVGLARPRRDDEQALPVAQRPPTRLAVAAALAAVTLAVLSARLLLTEMAPNAAFVLLEAVIPAAVMGLSLLVATWFGVALSGGLTAPLPAARIAIAAAAVGFFVHGMVDSSFWAPAPALAFWIAGGAALSQAHGGKDLRLQAAGVLSVMALLLLAAGWVAWPVLERTSHARAAAAALADADVRQGLRHMDLAVEADPHDAMIAADAARIFATYAGPGDQTLQYKARDLAQEAVQRNSFSSGHWRTLAHVTWRDDGDAPSAPVAVGALRSAVRWDPWNLRLRIEFARLLIATGSVDEAAEQIQAARYINQQLNPESVERMTPAELDDLDKLEARAAGS